MRKALLNPVVRFASLEIDGKEYRLLYSFNAIAEAEEAAGCNLLHGIGATLSTMTAGQLRGLFLAALMTAQPELTAQQAGELIRIDTLPLIIEKLSEAFALSMPEKKANPPEAAPAQTQSSQTKNSGKAAGRRRASTSV